MTWGWINDDWNFRFNGLSYRSAIALAIIKSHSVLKYSLAGGQMFSLSQDQPLNVIKLTLSVLREFAVGSDERRGIQSLWTIDFLFIKAASLSMCIAGVWCFQHIPESLGDRAWVACFRKLFSEFCYSGVHFANVNLWETWLQYMAQI